MKSWEIILEGMIKEKKKEIEATRNGGMHPGEAYIQGLEHELIGLQKTSFIIPAIKNNAFGTSDEVIEKRYQSRPFKPEGTRHSSIEY